MHNDTYDKILEMLYIIGVYGRKETTPDFIPIFEKWLCDSPYNGRVPGIERHVYGQKMKDSVLDVEKIREDIQHFLQD